MKTYIISFLLMIIGFNTYGQVNLVPNPSMEDYFVCPDNYSCIGMDDEIFYWVDKWMIPTPSTSDYFNVCSEEHVGVPINDMASYQTARTGNAYCGIMMYTSAQENYREYLQIELTGQGLKEGTCYEFEYYLNPCFNTEGYAMMYLTSDKIGAYFSTDRLTDFMSTQNLEVEPQIENAAGNFFHDSSTWEIVSGFYEAEGGEKWLTIGNFYPDSLTDLKMLMGDTIISTLKQCYFLIEDVSLKACYPDTSTTIQSTFIDPPQINRDFFNDNIIITNIPSGKYFIRFYDLSGKLVLQELINSNEEKYQFNIGKQLFFISISDISGNIIFSKLN